MSITQISYSSNNSYFYGKGGQGGIEIISLGKAQILKIKKELFKQEEYTHDKACRVSEKTVDSEKSK